MADHLERCMRTLREARQHALEWSKDPTTKVGALIVDRDWRPVSQGYNGFPKGIEDTEERLNDREVKWKMTVHAEINALIFARQSIKGCRLITWPFLPCDRCIPCFINAGNKSNCSLFLRYETLTVFNN